MVDDIMENVVERALLRGGHDGEEEKERIRAKLAAVSDQLISHTISETLKEAVRVVDGEINSIERDSRHLNEDGKNECYQRILALTKVSQALTHSEDTEV